MRPFASPSASASASRELPEILDGIAKPVLERHLRFPSELAFRERDIGLPLLGVVRRKRLEHELRLSSRDLDHLLGELEHRKLAGVADVDRSGKVRPRVHHEHERVDEVVDVAERPRLLAVAVDGDILAPKGLHDEVAHDAPVVRVHARAVRVEYAHDLDLDRVLPVIVEEQRLRAALSLVVAGPDADRVDVSPV